MKKLATICIFLTIIFALSACGKAETEKNQKGFEPSMNKDESVTLYFVGDYDNFEALEAVVVDFNKIYPNCNIVYEKLDDYYGSGLTNRLVSNKNVDLFMEANSTESGTANAYDLNNIGVDFSALMEQPVAACVNKEGKMLSMPMALIMHGFMVNEDILKANGINVPKTYSELCSACDKLIAAGYDTPIRGYNGTFFYDMCVGEITVDIAHMNNPEQIYDLIQNRGEGYEDYLYPYFDKVREMAEKGYINVEANDEIKDDYESTLLAFLEGKTPFMVASGKTFSGSEKREKKSEYYQSNPFSYSFMPIALSEDGCKAYGRIFVTFSINKNSENLEWATEFMRFAMTKEELDTFSSVKRVWSMAENSNTALFSQFEDIDSNNLLFAGTYPIHNQFLNSFSATAIDMLRNGYTNEDAIEAFENYMSE